MYSTTLSVFVAFLFFITITEAGKRVDKIIIHVPYKILKHHHTHTKYKIITVHHNPKKENTIIYYKPPVDQHTEVKFPHDMEMKDSELKIFVPPQQMSEHGALQAPDTKEPEHLKVQEISGKKPIELHSHEGFSSSFSFKPTISHHLQESDFPMTFHKPMISMHQHQIPQIFLKPFILPTPSHEALAPKLPFKSIMPASHEIFTMKFNSMMLPHKLMHNPLPSKLPDSIPHTSSHIYQTIIPPRPPKKFKSYAVREANQEGSQPPLTFARHPQGPVPKPKNVMSNLIETNDKPDYEHVGYLIIDGDQRKVVGKDKHSLYSWG